MTTPWVFFHGTSPEAAAVILQTGFVHNDRGGYREWCVPAELINAHSKVTVTREASLP